MGTDIALPRFRSHKEVWALKIAFVGSDSSGEGPLITPADSRYAKFVPSYDWVSRYKPKDDDLGYWVRYADGYESWSPTKAFEDGYTRV